MHRDIKPENTFVCSSPEDAALWCRFAGELVSPKLVVVASLAGLLASEKLGCDMLSS